jgi:hypothetical protein
MIKGSRGIASVLFAAVLLLGLAGCGNGSGDGLLSGAGPAATPPVAAKTGILITDSWGDPGPLAVQVAAPAQVVLVLAAHSQLADSSRTIVSGQIPTTVRIWDTTPSGAAAFPGKTCLRTVEIALGTATSVFPTPTVTLDLSDARPGGAVAGETLTAYSYDPGTGTWISPQPVQVDGSGKVAFQATRLQLWGIFR